MNNRELKFRVWLHDTKKWGDVACIEVFNSTGKLEYLYQDQPYTIQQYTGLKDKNGVEIYEGDIVQIVEKDETRIYDIVFSHGYFGLNRGPKSKHALMYPYTDVFEIVGNIMQNPELIKTNE